MPLYFVGVLKVSFGVKQTVWSPSGITSNFPKSIQRGGGGGYSTNFYAGRLRPEVQTLILLYAIFMKEVLLSYTFF